MIRVKMHEAKTHLSRLAAKAAAGEEVILMRGDVPIARIVPLEPASQPSRQFGKYKGLIDLDDRFFEPLPDDELEAWNNPK